MLNKSVYIEYKHEIVAKLQTAGFSKSNSLILTSRKNKIRLQLNNSFVEDTTNFDLFTSRVLTISSASINQSFHITNLHINNHRIPFYNSKSIQYNVFSSENIRLYDSKLNSTITIMQTNHIKNQNNNHNNNHTHKHNTNHNKDHIKNHSETYIITIILHYAIRQLPQPLGNHHYHNSKRSCAHFNHNFAHYVRANATQAPR